MLFASVTVALVVLHPREATAAEEDAEESSSAAMDANRGLVWGFGPVLLLPTDGGPLGGGLDLGARYGFKAGPTVLAPGGLAAGYFFSGRFVGTVMPTFRVTVPAGPLAPFVMGGLGPGWVSNPGQGGLAMLAGGGLLVHFGRAVAIGGEVTYQKITNTEFESVAIGPSIRIGG